MKETLAELYESRFDMMQTDFENQLELLEHLTTTYENGLDDIEERGYLGGAQYYEALKNVEQQNIDIMKQELADLTQAMSDAVNSGYIAEGSESWLNTSYVVWQHTRHNLFNCWETFLLYLLQRNNEIYLCVNARKIIRIKQSAAKA